MSKWLKIFSIFWLGSFFESWKNTSIEPGVKIQHFFNFSAIFRTISDFASTKKKKKMGQNVEMAENFFHFLTRFIFRILKKCIDWA